MNLPLVIDAQTLAEQLASHELLIIDLSTKENYLAGHVPGAIHLDPALLQNGQQPIPNKLPNLEQLSALVTQLNLTDTTHVVAYDDQKGPLAGRLIWTLNLLGYDGCSFLNGHLAAWKNAGLPTETTPAERFPSATPIEASIVNPELLTSKEVLITEPNSTAVWDARSPAEYKGEKVVKAKKGGHIPGAINFEWTQCFSNSTGELKPAQQLKAELTATGLDAEKPITTHCQTHRRSGLTYIAGKHAGLNMRCYDGSWFEWGNDDHTPVSS